MPEEIDLPPGEYRERKPKGWRWRLPWGHPDDNKLHLVVFLVALGFVGYFLTNLPAGNDFWVCVGVGVFAFSAGAQFILFMRD